MRFEAALVGNLEEVMKEESDRAARAVSSGTRKTVDDLKAQLRAVTMAAFGSQKLANAWRSQVFPKPPKVSMGAAGTVFSNAPHIVEAFSAATTIRGKNGNYLSIPAPAALGQGGKRITPGELERRMGIRLRFVFRPGKASLLVADKVRQRKGKRGGYAAASAAALRRGDAESGIVMFFLVPLVRLKQVFNLEGEYDRALDALAENILAEWNA
jgi:hypothetical protein